LCFYLQRGTSERSSTSLRLFLPICLMYCYSLQIKMGLKKKRKKQSGIEYANSYRQVLSVLLFYLETFSTSVLFLFGMSTKQL
jgi:hypothetical protein